MVEVSAPALSVGVEGAELDLKSSHRLRESPLLVKASCENMRFWRSASPVGGLGCLGR